LAGLFYAMYSYLIFQNLTLVEIPLFMTLLHAFVLIMVLLRERAVLDRRTWALAALGGIVLGLGMLTRPVIAPLATFVAVWFLFRVNLKRTILWLLPVVVISILVITPWIVRNYGVYNALVLISTNAGENFWFGNSKYTVPYLRAGFHSSFSSPQGQLDGLTAPQANAKLFSLGLQYLRENPGESPDLVSAKFLAYWSIDVFPTRNPVGGQVVIPDYHGNPQMTVDSSGNMQLQGVPPSDPITAYSQPLFDQVGRVVHRFYFGTALALAGIALTATHWREVSLLWFVQICMTLVYVVFVPATRYRVPSDPILFLFSAYTLAVLWQCIRMRRLAHTETASSS
jgi:4-amino-4-deoxy-L-arabinose transferase-like glycosyltransferase